MVARLSYEQLSALRRIDSPTISNAIETFNVRPRVAGYVGYDIRCMFPDLPPTLGYAVTCTVDSTTEGREGIGFNKLYELLKDAPKPAIVVMQDVGPDRVRSCHAGEVMATTMKHLGAVGILTDGGLRDAREVHAMGGFQFFCAGLVVSHGNPICVSVGDEVTISGMRVRCGDLLHGDINGVVHIPDECADKVAEAAYRIWAREEETMRQIAGSQISFSGSEIKH
ncbi:RraA family protein [Ktedonosporobacter rubrisoli]|uniref:Putative 4-hydroxy-4-methyl-2-oxoglutarate aldolase n=1 Tax=Ktedonosporobacter rubrisoli TaxID=2509675 RepID=A0A4P6JQ48_KTERU|nr:RraA family protein [Ktedonosporobacter rubrisoli]QBD77519.1 RraA family protein [Ktedonosporobacter rubrisoli]